MALQLVLEPSAVLAIKNILKSGNVTSKMFFGTVILAGLLHI